ncbi:MAG: dethiobiotin synthase [Nitrospirota bacterium]
MKKGVFITGTDTGVGKTIIAALVIRLLRQRGVRAGVMKPIETGCESIYGALMPKDGTYLRAMAEADDSIDLVTPLRFRYPLAPLVAAELEEKPVDLSRVMSAYEALSKRYEFLVVEGAGGLLVPIARDASPLPAPHHGSPYFMRDLARDMELPLVIVARATLGTINHTLLTVEHALSEGLNVLGVIINYSSPGAGGIAEKTNPDALRELCPVPILGTVPYIEGITRGILDTLALTAGDSLAASLLGRT